MDNEKGRENCKVFMQVFGKKKSDGEVVQSLEI